MSKDSLEALVAFFQSLGNSVRMRILLLLQAEGEMNVGQLVERLGLTQGHVSNHLSCLRTCGAVCSRQEGRWVYYRLAGAEVAHILDVARIHIGSQHSSVVACPVLRQEVGPGYGEGSVG